MNSSKAIELIESTIIDSRVGLPLDVFRFISRNTPMINVDLLVKDENGRTLLAWRDEENYVSGWHIPGGIIRYKETIESRIIKVAKAEIGVIVDFDPVPLALNQIICAHVTRGHFISLLYRCYLNGAFIPENEGLNETDQGFLKWHEKCPDNLIKVHEMYRKYICADIKEKWQFETDIQEHGPL